MEVAIWDDENDKVRLIEALRTHGRVDNFEARFRAKDGRLGYGLMSATVIDLDGLPHVLTITRDITARKRVEEALRGSEIQLAAAMDLAGMAYWTFDSEAREFVFNDAFYRIYGTTAEREGGYRIAAQEYARRFIHPDDLTLFQRSAEENYAKPSRDFTFDIEHRIMRADGVIRHVAVKIRFIKDETGRILRGYGVTQDITERKAAEEALQASEDKYRSIVERTTEWIWEMDASGMHTFSNVAVSRILGYPPEEVMGLGVEHLLHEEDLAEVRAKLPQLMAEKRGWKGWVLRWRHRDGSYRYLESNAQPVLDAAGNLLGYRGADRDVTERIQAEEERERLQAQLNQAQRMESVGRLAGGVAHDFNNMLTAVLGYTELAMMRCNPAEPLYEDLKIIESSARQSARLVTQLLAFARKQTVAPLVLDLNETIAGMLKMLKPLIGEDIDFAWVPGGNLWPVRVDPSQVDQLLANLCVNARDAITGVGRITVETKNAVFDRAYCDTHADYAPGEYVMLAVSDNGCGMDRQTVAQVFEPFFTTKEMGKGTGLGLATVYGIVRQNGGFINVYSEPDEGSSFRIYLPHAEGEAAEEVSAPAPAAPPAAAGETVLLVEDDVVILTLAKSILEHLGYTVLTAAMPADALHLARDRGTEIDLLITDVVMPEMNGRDLAARIREMVPGLKCLFASGYSADVIAHHNILDDGVNFIEKPFSVKALATKVREVLDRE